MLLDRGRVLAAGPTDSMLRAGSLIRKLYGVDVDITTNRRTGHLHGGARRARADAHRVMSIGRQDRGDLALIRRWARSSCAWLAPLVGSTTIEPPAGVRLLDSLRRQTPTRRSSSWRGCRACSPARWSDRRWPRPGVVLQALLRNPLATPFTLGVSAGAALGAMLALTLGPVVRHRRVLGGADRQLRRLARRRRHRLGAGARAASRPLDQRAAARRRHAEFVFLGADSLRAVPGGLHADVPDGTLAHGRSRRQQLRSARRRRCRPSRSRSRAFAMLPRIDEPAVDQRRKRREPGRRRASHAAAGVS